MTSVYRKCLVALLAVLALGAAAASAASAAQWYVGGKALASSEKLAETAKVEEALTFAIPTLGDKWQCTGLAPARSKLVATGTLQTGEWLVSGCKTLEPKECFMTEFGEGFSTEASLSLGTSPADKAEFGGQLFGFESISCLGGLVRFTSGKLPLSMPTGQTEEAEQAFVGEGTKAKATQALSYEGNKVYVTGEFKLKLASGAKWSFH